MKVHPLDFRAERDADSTSWDRADPVDALIGSPGALTWLVTLPGGECHRVALWFDPSALNGHGSYVGACNCKAWQYHSGDERIRYPCAHLCTLRQAAVTNERFTEHGEPVRIREHERTERKTTLDAADAEPVTDGGEITRDPDDEHAADSVDRAIQYRREVGRWGSRA